MKRITLTSPEGPICIQADKIITFYSVVDVPHAATRLYIEGIEGPFNIVEDVEMIKALLVQEQYKGTSGP